MDTAAMVLAPLVDVGDRIDRYTIRRVIHGARDIVVCEGVTDHDERFALKRAPRESAERERQALIRLKRADQECQHVVRLHDHIEEARGGGGGSWLVLELGEISLSLWLRERGHAPSWVETLDVGHAIGNALAFVHGCGLVCGDVKPSNVVRFSGGLQRWKLIDLGAAAESGQGVMEFSSSYCSPELAKCFLHGSMARASKCSDVWAYGKIMYEMAVGSPSALLAPVGGDGGEEETRRVLEQVAGLGDCEGEDVVDESKLRFIVLRSMLRGSLRVRGPRMSMTDIMSRGFWTGNLTSTTKRGDEGGVGDRGARASAVMELIETEAQYCERLRQLSLSFIDPLRVSIQGGTTPPPGFRIFDDIEVLLRSNEFFLRQLRARVEAEGSKVLGDIMSEFARTLLRNYEEYVTRYSCANEQVQEAKRRSRDFRDAVSRGVGEQGEPVEMFLILPVQRLMRYKLLLSQILYHTPDKDGDEFRRLEEALAAVCETVDAINDKALCSQANWDGDYQDSRAPGGDEGETGLSTMRVVAVVGGAAVAGGMVYFGMKWVVKVMEAMREAREEALIHKARAEESARIALEAAARLQQYESTGTREAVMWGIGGATVMGMAIAASPYLLMLSDERLKRDKRRVGRSPSGISVWRYAYLWDRPGTVREGVMAQEVLELCGASSTAVVHVGHGVLAVDYSLLDVRPTVEVLTQEGL